MDMRCTRNTKQRHLICFFILWFILIFIVLFHRLTRFQDRIESEDIKSVRQQQLPLLLHHRKQNSITWKELDNIRIDMKKSRRTVKINAKRCHHELPYYRPPKTIEILETFEWQAVGDDEKAENYLFSAYLDRRTEPPVIRIIGISRAKSGTLNCQLWYPDEMEPIVVEAELNVLKDSHDRRYDAVFYLCYLPTSPVNHLQPVSQLILPYAVSLVREQCQLPSNFVKIIQNDPEVEGYRINFTVCVSPLNFHYNNYHELIETIEINRLFGVEKFFFYNHTTGSDVREHLMRYVNDGICEIIPWKIPVMVDSLSSNRTYVTPEVHYFAQMAALNDCLYRNMLTSRFIAFTDLDEIIVPRNQSTWNEMLERITVDWQERFNALNNGRRMFPGAYLFRNVFFWTDWNDILTTDDDNDDEVLRRLRLTKLLKMRREEETSRWFVRSKFIVWSKMVTSVGIHSVLNFIDDHVINHVMVRLDDALLHHYRTSFDDRNLHQIKSINDTTIQRFKHDVIRRVSQRHRTVGIS